jgi:hypothetical protein
MGIALLAAQAQEVHPFSRHERGYRRAALVLAALADGRARTE